MVDFDNEATIGTPAVDIVRVLLLQHRANVFEALEDYHKKIWQGTDIGLAVVRSRVFTWWLEVQAALRRRMKPEKYEELKDKIINGDEKELLETIFELNEMADNIRLTRLDTKPVYDRTDVEAENLAHGA